MKINRKYIGIFLSAGLLAFGSVMFVKASQEVNVLSTGLYEFIGPFLYLLFNHYFIEAKTLKGRLTVTVIQSAGLSVGSMLTLYFLYT